MQQSIDALFIPHYVNCDRWDNDDGDPESQASNPARTQALISALSNDVWMKDEVDLVIDGRVYDFGRFLVGFDTATCHSMAGTTRST